jgi:hypothetical protein
MIQGDLLIPNHQLDTQEKTTRGWFGVSSSLQQSRRRTKTSLNLTSIIRLRIGTYP